MSDINIKLQKLIDTVNTLRGDKGCPWDKKQTNSSLKQYIYEECQELLLAITQADHENICEELGDVLYLLIMVSAINQEMGLFEFEDVIESIHSKLIRRHPHVFAGLPYENEDQLTAQWQAIKATEKNKNSI